MRYIKILMLALFAFSLGVHAADPPAAATYRALDDKLYVLGTDNDFQITFDSSDTRIEIRDAAGNVLGRVSDAGTTGVIGFKQFDVINGSYASQITSGATANRAVTLPDAAGEISLLGQTIATGEIVDGTIVNADVSASAAIVPTKLSAGTDGQVVVTASSAAGWGTVPTAGITNGTILNEDINASAAIAVTKLSTSGASTDYVLTYNGSAIVWAPAAGTGDIEAGANLGTDNLIPRMDGTGSDTLQGYTSNGITASDAGLLTVPGGINASTGVIETEGGTVLLSDTSYLKYARDNEVRWDISYSTGSETGTSGETSLKFTAYDNDGNALREVMKLNRTATEGVVFGSNTAPSPVYVKGDIYAHTDDRLVIDDGYVRLDAIAQTSATLGQSIVWDGTKWAPSSVSVNWGSPGAIGSVSPSSGVFTTLTASSATFSEAKITDDNRLILGTDSDIQIIYDEATDNRMEVSDGTNLLMSLTDAGTTGNATITGTLTTGGKLTTVATATGAAGFNLPPGTAPSSPSNGDVWTTTTGVYARVNGATQTLGAGAKKRIQLWSDLFHGTFVFGAPAAANDLLSTSGREYWVIPFDASSDKAASTHFSLPSDFNAASPNVDIYIYWYNTAGGGSSEVRWGVQMAAASDGDPLNSGAATPTETILLDTREANDDICIASATNQNAIAGSPAAGDNVYIKIYRDADHVDDDQSGDAKLVMIAIEYTPA